MEKKIKEKIIKELKKSHEHGEETGCCFSEALNELMDYLEEHYDMVPKK